MENIQDIKNSLKLYKIVECKKPRPRWLRRIVGGFSLRRSRFAPRSVPLGFVVNKVPLGQDFLRVLPHSPVNIIAPLLPIRSYNYNLHQACTTRSLRAACGPRKDFLWTRGDWLNHARAPEKLSLKINQV
jgi:hypothetical protein